MNKIIKESISILIITSIISSTGGAGLNEIKERLVKNAPLLIIIPALNDLVGDLGIITSSRFTTMLFLGTISNKWWKSKELWKLFKTLIIVSIILSFYISFLSVIIGKQPQSLIKILIISLTSVIVLNIIIFAISIIGGLIIYKKGHNPDNYLIPITTSISDLSMMITITILSTIILR